MPSDQRDLIGEAGGDRLDEPLPDSCLLSSTGEHRLMDVNHDGEGVGDRVKECLEICPSPTDLGSGVVGRRDRHTVDPANLPAVVMPVVPRRALRRDVRPRGHLVPSGVMVAQDASQCREILELRHDRVRLGNLD